jgi:LacI family transcriptional regulator
LKCTLSETRERIQNIIDELGYRPNRIASAMRGSSRVIGVVGYGLEYYGPSHTLIGVENAASDNDYSISLQLVRDPEDFDIEEIINSLLDNLVDAIVWCVPQIGNNFEAINQYAENISTPLIYTDVYSQDATLVVHSDNYAGGCVASQHLIDNGHRHIGIITGPQGYASARERLRGWRDTLAKHDLDTSPSLIAEGDWTAVSGATCFQQLIQKNPDLTAIFAGNDQMALGAMHVARDMGLKIPDDIAFVGYDDIPEAEYFYPPLTSVRQDTIQLGSLAVHHVIDVIEKLQIDEIVTPILSKVEPQLIVRSSSLANSNKR